MKIPIKSQKIPLKLKFHQDLKRSQVKLPQSEAIMEANEIETRLTRLTHGLAAEMLDSWWISEQKIHETWKVSKRKIAMDYRGAEACFFSIS